MFRRNVLSLAALACLVGYFGYETYGLIEQLPRPAPNELGLPDMLFVRPTVILAFDRLADRLTLHAALERWRGQWQQPGLFFGGACVG